MSIVRVSPGLQEKQDVFSHLNQRFVNKAVSFIINWRYRKAVLLCSWLENQVKTPSKAVLEALEEVPTDKKDMDRQAVLVLRWVEDHIEYIRDKEKWDMPDYWQTAEETLDKRNGDCEDGMTLIYVLCRLKGIPANRLLCSVGDVKGGAHAWLAYRPTSYPFNFVYLDWCYWYKADLMSKRQVYSITKKAIKGYEPTAVKDFYIPIESNYYKLWFVFNEEVSNTEVVYAR